MAQRDDDALEGGRDWHDDDGVPWHAEVWSAGAVLVLLVVLPVLIAFFALIEALTD